MLNRMNVIEKQLKYSGYEESWIKRFKKTGQDLEKWETVCEQIDSSDIVYSFIYGNKFNIENAIFATSKNIVVVFKENLDDRIVKEIFNYTEIRSIKIFNSKGKRYILSIQMKNRVINFEITDIYSAVHIRKTILNEIFSYAEVNKIKEKSDFIINEKAEESKNEIKNIEDEIEFEPISNEHKHRNFNDNFIKIKTIYHVRRIAGGLLIAWSIIFFFCLLFNVWTIYAQIDFNSNQKDLKTIVPFFLSFFNISLISFSCGTLLYFYIYQRHLKNKIINMLCLITFLCYSSTTASQIVIDTFYQVFIQKDGNSDSFLRKFRSIQIIFSAFGIITSVFTFAPLIILNYGIHHKIK